METTSIFNNITVKRSDGFLTLIMTISQARALQKILDSEPINVIDYQEPQSPLADGRCLVSVNVTRISLIEGELKSYLDEILKKLSAVPRGTDLKL